MIPKKFSLAVLLTCYNRRKTTLTSLQSLFDQCRPEGVNLKVFLVDDGCTDGTGDAVRFAFPQVQVIQGDGSLFWCNGMRRAWEHAVKDDPDFYLWLNDDVELENDALIQLLQTYCQVSSGRSINGSFPAEGDATSRSSDPSQYVPSIIIGSCRDSVTGEHAYGGQRRLGIHPGKLAPVVPEVDQPVECDTFQGNIVLISRAVYERVGTLRSFNHAMGDTDYGYRAVQAGCKLWVAPRYIGVCGINRKENMNERSNLSLIERFQIVRKRIPPSDWLRFLWAHAGGRALLYWPRIYVRVLLNRDTRS